MRLSPTAVGTFSGKLVDLLDPDPRQVDIAEALSKSCRFNGNINAFFSVAQYSVNVSTDVERATRDYEAAYAALLHDAHETYIGDIITPVRVAVDAEAVAAIERRLDVAIGSALGIDIAKHKSVGRSADVQNLYHEALRFGSDAVDPASRRWVPFSFRPDPHYAQPLDPAEAFTLFMSRYRYLRRRIFGEDVSAAFLRRVTETAS
jgi:hypothetical protein